MGAKTVRLLHAVSAVSIVVLVQVFPRHSRSSSAVEGALPAANGSIAGAISASVATEIEAGLTSGLAPPARRRRFAEFGAETVRIKPRSPRWPPRGLDPSRLGRCHRARARRRAARNGAAVWAQSVYSKLALRPRALGWTPA